MSDHTVNALYSPYFEKSSSSLDEWSVYEGDLIEYQDGYQKYSAEDNRSYSPDITESNYITETGKCVMCKKNTLKCFVLCSDCFMVTRRNNIRRVWKHGYLAWTLRNNSKCTCPKCQTCSSAGLIIHRKGGHVVSCYYDAQKKLQNTIYCYVCMKPYVTLVRKP